MPRIKERPPTKRVAYTIAEVASMVGRDRSTVWRWVERGILVPIPVPGGKRLISAASLEAFLRGEAKQPKRRKPSPEP